MARKPRIHLPGGFYHVMLRGNAGQEIFLTDEDRYHLYLLMQEGVERFGHRIHAFCCMSNHIHLAIQVADIPLSRIIQNLSFRYTLWFNKKQHRTGHLFQGRYAAILVDADDYLLELIRYIHLNPLRAGMVEESAAWRWSSHGAYLGKEALPWLTTEWVLGRFASQRGEAIRRYSSFIAEGGNADAKDFQRGEKDARILGDDVFAEKALASQGESVASINLDDCIHVVCKHYALTAADLAIKDQRRKPSEARAVIGWTGRQSGGFTLSEAARRFGRDVATMSLAVRRLQDRADKDKGLEGRLQLIFDECQDAKA